MKRILSVILCLAVFLSSMVIGVISVSSAESNETDTVVATGAPTSVGTLEGVTAKAGELKADENGNYYLTGDITVSSAADLAAVKEALNAGKTFDGKGYTITTSVPLFDTLTGGTLKNFTVKGDIGVTSNTLTENSAGVIANTIQGTAATEDAEAVIVVVNFENIKVAARLELVSDVSNPQMGGFVGQSKLAKVTFTDCASAGYIGSEEKSTKVGGFIDYTGLAGTETHFVNCTMSAKTNAGCHFGGFLSENNSNAVSSFTNCVADLNATDYVTGTAYSGGIVGYGKGQITVTNCMVTGTYDASSTSGKPFGGVVGQMKDNTGTGLVIDGFYMDADLKISNSTFGGLVAQFYANAIIDAKNVYFGSDVEVFDNQQSGGMLGLVDKGSTKITLTDCVFDGAINIKFDQATTAETWAGTMIGLIKNGVAEGIYLTNCGSISDATFNMNAANNGALCYAMIGRIQANGQKEIVFKDCYNTGDITVNCYTANTSGRNINLATLVGLYHTTAPLTIDGCYNTGNLAVYRYNVAAAAGGIDSGNNVAGLVACHYNAGASMTITNSYNTGDITTTSRHGYPYAGGLVARANSTNKGITIDNCYNTGAITATLWDGVGHTYAADKVVADGDKTNGVATEVAAIAGYIPQAAGIIAYQHGSATVATVINDCANYGEVKVVNELDDQGRVGGIAGTLVGAATVTASYNGAKVTLDTAYAGQPCGGIVGCAEVKTAEVEGAPVAYATEIDKCVNAGAVANGSDYAAGIVGMILGNAGKISDSVNTGAVTGVKAATIAMLTAPEGTFAIENCYATADTLADAVISYVETVPAEGEGEPTTTEKVVNIEYTATAVAAAPAVYTILDGEAAVLVCLAAIDADLATEFVDAIGVFTVTAAGTADGNDVLFTTTIDKAFYDAIEAGVGDANVAFDGIVTVKKYTDKIGAFTHKALDDYFTANKAALEAKGVTKLYMDADRVEANIVDADIDADGDYSVLIRLKGATANTTYAAKAFIKIGNAYIYSTIPAPVVADAQ